MTTTPPPIIHKYGILIERLARHGTTYIDARIVRREPGVESPLGVYGVWPDELPRHLKGVHLDGLCMHGFISDLDQAYIAYEPCYREVNQIGSDDLVKMTKGLKNFERAIKKAEAREPGDVFMAFCESIKAEFVTMRATDPNFTGSGTYSSHKWRWMTVREGRNAFRALIEQASADAKAKKEAA